MTTLLERGRRGLPVTDFEVIDMHAHIGRFAFSIPDTGCESLIEVMDRTGVARTAITFMPVFTLEDTEKGNQELHQAITKHPDRLMAYAYVTPDEPSKVEATTKRWLEAGFIGLKMHNMNGFPYTHPSYTPAFALANELRRPVLLHTYGQPEDFEQCVALAKQYPGISILMAHSGSGNKERYAQLASEHENLYLELALSLSPRGLVAWFVEHAGADKIIWGSDICFLDQTQQIGKVLGADIAEADKKTILSDNARRILARMGS
ncbi:MAG: amidohydrolase family protein [Candidatus Hydrogenedentota bacterium]